MFALFVIQVRYLILFFTLQHCYKLKQKNNNIDIQLENRFSLPPCKQRWVSAASLTIEETHLIGGDRAGTVHVFKWGGHSDQVRI